MNLFLKNKQNFHSENQKKNHFMSAERKCFRFSETIKSKFRRIQLKPLKHVCENHENS